MKTKTDWNISVSSYSLNTINPIRRIMENLNITPNPEKDLIALSIGDPTFYGNLKPSEIFTDIMVNTIKSNKFNGYLPSSGSIEAKQAIAEYSSTPEMRINANDVILTVGCSQALEISILTLVESGSNILIPKPGFPLYKTICYKSNIEIRQYNLLKDDNWNVNIDDLRSQIDHKTSAIIYNNPSNPCGSVYEENHIKEILKVAEEFKIPIIADEIYEHMVFPSKKFIPIASLSTQVPILTCGGISKRFIVPGYRVGWIIVHDRQNRFGIKIRNGLNNLTHIINGVVSIVQGALPLLLTKVPQSFFDDIMAHLMTNAEICVSSLKRIPGLKPYVPSGAMYLMVYIDLSSFPNIGSDREFVEELVKEESVFVLPGECFDITNHIRIVLTVPKDKMIEACRRIENFCLKYTMANVNNKEFYNSVKASNIIKTFALDK